MEWKSFGNPYIKKAFEDCGHQTVSFDFPSRSAGAEADEKMAVKIVEKVMAENIDLIFSFNFFPLIATAAKACRKPYAAWIYDSPAILTYNVAAYFDTSHIFHFDSGEVEKLKAAGVENVYYLPLACAESYEGMTPDEGRKRKYKADIAMIGSLYREERFGIFKKYESFDDHTKGYLEALINAQEKLYGVNFLEEAITDELMAEILKTVPLTERENSHATAKWTFANYYLAMQVTIREREHLLRALASEYDTAIYTPGKTDDIPGLRNLGTVDYYDEAPYAMKCAKVNLNITLRSIKCGIPLRIMDILGCGGFLLTNYQPDMDRHFAPGEDYIYYESVDDAVDKAAYYLEHEDERLRIAANGHKKAIEGHTYKHRVDEMLKIIYNICS